MGRGSLDDLEEESLGVIISILAPSPPKVVVVPRKTRDEGGAEEVEGVNREEVINALIQGLWIVWREGVVEENGHERRNSWAAGKEERTKRRWVDRVFCRR
jgi:hypothetical protein